MLIAGADASGDVKRGQIRVISFVLGTKTAIISTRNKIPVKKIHMKLLREKKETNFLIT